MKRLVALATRAGVLAFLVVAGLTSPAHAADTSLVVRSLDATDAPVIKAVVQYTGPLTSGVTGLTVRENGRIVPDAKVVPVAESATPVGVVVVLDASGSMRSNGRIEAAKQALRTFVEGRSAKEQIALVTFSDVPRVMHGFSADNGASVAADPVVPSGETALWDAVKTAVGMFTNAGDMQPNVLVLSDGTDSVSKANLDEARAAAVAAHVPVSAIGLTGDGFDGSSLSALASATGGRFLTTTNANDLNGLFGEIRRDLNQQFEVSWRSDARSPEVTFQLQGAIANGVVPNGGASQGSATRPVVVANGKGGVFAGGLGKMLALLLAAVGGVGAGVGGVLVFGNRGSGLKDRLASYGPDAEAQKVVRAKDAPIASTAVVQRAVEWTANAGQNVGLYGWIDKRLEVARLPLRAAEASFFTAAFALVAGAGMWAVKGPIAAFLCVVAVVGGALMTLAVLAMRTSRRFNKQLPVALQLLASSLRAGYSMLQGVDSVAHEIGGPFGAELRRVLAEARLGRPIEEALERSAERVGSPDYTWVVMAIGIQREVGGNLAELLDTVADTMRARTRLRGEVKALTAEGRASAIMLGIMPPALGAAMTVMSPGYMDPLFSDPIGKIMFGTAIVGVVGGFIWMQKIVKVDL